MSRIETFALLFAMFTLSSCLGLTNTNDAINAAATTTSAGCNSSSYSTNAESVMQGRCVVCHAAGGPGSGYFLLQASSGDSSITSQNYAAALSKLLSNDGGSTESNPIVAMPLGGSGHPVVFSDTTDSGFLSVRQWILDERTTSCQ